MRLRLLERRWHVTRRLTVYIEPRDLWVGLYIEFTYLYICLVPTLVLRWERGERT